MTLRESIELADKKLEKMGFDSVEKAMIFMVAAHSIGKIDWLITASKDDINAWYNHMCVAEILMGI